MTRELALTLTACALLAAAIFQPRGLSGRRRTIVACSIGAAWLALVGVSLYVGHEPFRDPAFGATVYVLGAVAILLQVRFLVRSWHDDEALEEEFGPRDGYIARPHRLSTRARALLLVLGAMLALFAAFLFTAPFTQVPAE